MKSIFAARQCNIVAGHMIKPQFNMLVAVESSLSGWRSLSDTQPVWYWLCELSAYLELKHLGYE